MKRLTVTNPDACHACLECVIACSETFYKEFDAKLSCIRIVPGKEYLTAKPKTCIQCGKCMRTCQHEAIMQLPNGVFMINKAKCVGCGECVEACPMQVMVLKDDKASKCISCGICAKNCPMTILTIVES